MKSKLLKPMALVFTMLLFVFANTTNVTAQASADELEINNNTDQELMVEVEITDGVNSGLRTFAIAPGMAFHHVFPIGWTIVAHRIGWWCNLTITWSSWRFWFVSVTCIKIECWPFFCFQWCFWRIGRIHFVTFNFC